MNVDWHTVLLLLFLGIPALFFLPYLVAAARWWWKELCSAWRGEW